MPEPIRYDRPTDDVHKYSESMEALLAMQRQIEQQIATARAAEVVVQATATQPAVADTTKTK